MVNKSGNKQLVNRGLHKKQLRASERANRGNGDAAAAPSGVAGIAWKSAQKIVQGIFGGGTVRHRGPPKLADAQGKETTDGDTASSSSGNNRRHSGGKSAKRSDSTASDLNNDDNHDHDDDNYDDDEIQIYPLREDQNMEAVTFMKRLHLKQDMWEFYAHTLLQWRSNLFLLCGCLFTFLWTGSWEMSLISASSFIAAFLVYLTYLLIQSPNNHPDLKDLYAYYSEDGKKSSGVKKQFWVAMNVTTDRIVGTVAVDKRTTDVAQLKRMFVDTAHRRRGIGTRLVQRAVEFCAKNSYKEIVLYSSGAQKRAQLLYQKCGFVKERSSMERILLWWFWEVCYFKYHLDDSSAKKK